MGSRYSREQLEVMEDVRGAEVWSAVCDMIDSLPSPLWPMETKAHIKACLRNYPPSTCARLYDIPKDYTIMGFFERFAQEYETEGLRYAPDAPQR